MAFELTAEFRRCHVILWPDFLVFPEKFLVIGPLMSGGQEQHPSLYKCERCRSVRM